MSVYEVTADMVQHVGEYVNYVRHLSKRGTLFVEQRLSIGHLTGEADAHGTSDAVIIVGDELIVVDLKYGMGEVVSAENNKQLLIYALAALEHFSLSYEINTVRLVIHQPRVPGGVSEWDISVADINEFALSVTQAAKRTQLPDAPLAPSVKGCRWCKATGACPALRNEVLEMFESTSPEVATVDRLSEVMAKAGMIESWLKGIRAETETRLFAGVAVPGWKLVQGKKGNRQWRDADEAERVLKAMRVPHDAMYDYKVISPTTADKLAKAGIVGPRQWPKVQALITQSEGGKSVAPEADKRPALDILAASTDFDDVSTPSSVTDLS